MSHNLRGCPYCDYNFLFPPADQQCHCPVCGKLIVRSKDDELHKEEQTKRDSTPHK
jgi:uncharacterized paraquat-inducible protein A